MEENKSLWNTKVNDLTVGDQIKVAAVAPIIVMAGMAAPLVVISVCSKTADKFREVRENRKNKNLEVVK